MEPPDLFALVNGQFVSVGSPGVAALDRGLLYGDGLFETIRAYDGVPFLFEAHIERLNRSAAELRICDGLDPSALRQEVEKLLEAAKGTVYHDIIRAFLCTGMRLRELGYLRWEDVDLERGVIMLRSYDERPLKTHHERVIPINETMREILERWRERTGRFKYVFATPKGRPRMNNVLTNVKRLVEKAGLADVNVNVLRHTFATELVSRGVDVSHVRALMGHSSITTTQIYLHASTRDLRNAVEKLKFEE